MDKYIVKVVHVFSNLVEVEAESEDDARHKALENVQNTKEELKNYYESTLPIENWAVIEKTEFDKIKAEVEEKIKAKKSNEEEPNIIVP
jgi:hypothetical protein